MCCSRWKQETVGRLSQKSWWTKMNKNQGGAWQYRNGLWCGSCGKRIPKELIEKNRNDADICPYCKSKLRHRGRNRLQNHQTSETTSFKRIVPPLDLDYRFWLLLTVISISVGLVLVNEQVFFELLYFMFMFSLLTFLLTVLCKYEKERKRS